MSFSQVVKDRCFGTLICPVSALSEAIHGRALKGWPARARPDKGLARLYGIGYTYL